jgi:hypothetical protein
MAFSERRSLAVGGEILSEDILELLRGNPRRVPNDFREYCDGHQGRSKPIFEFPPTNLAADFDTIAPVNFHDQTFRVFFAGRVTREKEHSL